MSKLLQLQIPGLSGVSNSQIEIFARTMAVMLQSGVPITEALVITQETLKGRFQKVLQHISTSVQSGRSLSEALEHYPHLFSNYFVRSVKLGEATGKLDKSLVEVADQLSKDRELMGKIRAAMVYPAIVLSAAVGLGGWVVIMVLPKLLPLFAQLKVELPWTTQLLIGVTKVLSAYGIYMAVIGIPLVLVGIWWGRKHRGLWDWVELHLPIFGNMTRQLNLTRIFSALGRMLNSGMPIDEAVEIASGYVQNGYYRHVLLKLYERVNQGSSISEELRHHPELFPGLAVRMLASGEQSGRLDETCTYLGDYYEKETDRVIKILPSIIEPILLLMLGLGVAFLALAIMTPIFNLSAGIR